MSFVPEHFALEPKVQQYQLDQEVAARIANTLYQGDKECQAGNNYYEADVIVDPTGETTTHSFMYGDEDNPDADKGFRVSFEAEDDDVNKLFGIQMKTALNEGERQNRLGVAGSLGMVAGLAAIPGAFTAIALETPQMNTVGKAEFVAFGAVIVSPFMHISAKHLYRLNMVKPDTYLNKRHLQVAGRIVERLGLPPVVTK